MIIGLLCYIGMSILKLPYTMLISVIIGITNVIPFFGPYIGAVPSAFLILLINPLQCLYFIIFILVLQQFDGNFLGPKILGDTTGLSSFMVIVAILVGEDCSESLACSWVSPSVRSSARSSATGSRSG